MVDFIQPSFAKGEIADDLYGRVDVRAYQTALRKARNMIVHEFGGISNRPGLKYICNVKEHTNTPRLIPFKFKNTDTLILEFGNQYIRFLRNDVQVKSTDIKNITNITQANPGVVTVSSSAYANGTEITITGVLGMTQVNNIRYVVANSTGSTFTLKDQVTLQDINTTSFSAYTSDGSIEPIYEITSPYQQSELRELRYVQTGDIITITHPNHAPHELKRFAVNNWTLSPIVFRPTISFPTNLASTGGSLGVDSYYVVTAVGSNGEESLPAINSTSATITAITLGTTTSITAAAHGFVDGDIVHLDNIVGTTELNNRRFTVSNAATNTFDLLGENSTTYTAYVSGGDAWLTHVFNTNSTGVTVTWDSVVGAVRYRIYKRSSGVFGFVTQTSGTSIVIAGTETPDVSDTPPQLVEPFLGVDNYPRAVGFHQQRMVMGGSNNKPETTYYSVVGNFKNFSAASPIRADDSFSATLSSKIVNEIQHYLSLRDLLIFTSGSEWAIGGTSGDSRFSIDTVQQNEQTNWGSDTLPPITIAQTVLFATSAQNKFLSTAFAFEHDHYVTKDVSIYSRHLFEHNRVLEWDMVRTFDPIVYMVRDDGEVLALTYNEEQEVIAWTTWDTNGNFESVAVTVPSSDELEDHAYFVIKRKINGNTVRYIERTTHRFFKDVRDCFFVDAGASYDSPIDISNVVLNNPIVINTSTAHGFSNGDEVDIFDIVWKKTLDTFGREVTIDQLNDNRYTIANVTSNSFTIDVNGTDFNDYISGGVIRKAVSTISGITHLKNTPVAVLADGNVITGLTVNSSGVLSLSRKFSRVHIGLQYVSDIETLDPEPLSRSGTSIQMKEKHISDVTVRFKKSRGMLIGPDEDNLVEMKQREFEDMGDPTELLTGDKTVVLSSNWTGDGRIFIRQKDPLPMTILMLMPNLEVGS